MYRKSVTESGDWAAEKGNYLISKLEIFAAQYPQIYEKITGKGLLIVTQQQMDALLDRLDEVLKEISTTV